MGKTMEHTKEFATALEALERAALAETDRCRMLRLLRVLELLRSEPCDERTEFAIAGIPLSEI